MESRLNHFETKKTARVFELGNPEKAKCLLIALHGYGQSAAYFIQKFKELGDDYLIVCPEALHQFYLNGTSGRVGASWMTKEDRLTAIADNQYYLEEVIRKYAALKDFEQTIVLGFSQGGASAARIEYTKLKVDHLILWACVFPPDIDPVFSQLPKEKSFVLGTKDVYFDEAAQKTVRTWYKNNDFNVLTFEGKHEIDPIILKNVIGENKI